MATPSNNRLADAAPTFGASRPMMLAINCDEPSLETLLDKIVDGEMRGQTFNLVMHGVPDNVVMMIHEIICMHKGKTVIVDAACSTHETAQAA